MISKKYEEEYRKSGDDVHQFIKLVMRKGLNYQTVRRRFYDCRKVYRRPIVLKRIDDLFDHFNGLIIDSEGGLVIKPSVNKLKLYVDMKRLKKDIDEDFLFKYGFCRVEINY